MKKKKPSGRTRTIENFANLRREDDKFTAYHIVKKGEKNPKKASSGFRNMNTIFYKFERGNE